MWIKYARSISLTRHGCLAIAQAVLRRACSHRIRGTTTRNIAMSELTKGRLWAALSSLVVRQGKRPDHQDGARAAFAHYWLRAAAAVAHLNAPSPPPAARLPLIAQRQWQEIASICQSPGQAIRVWRQREPIRFWPSQRAGRVP
jgi:hypothetical protein